MAGVAGAEGESPSPGLLLQNGTVKRVTLREGERPRGQEESSWVSPEMGLRLQRGSPRIVEGQAGEALGRAFSRPCQPQEAGGEAAEEDGVTESRAPPTESKEQGRAFWKLGRNKGEQRKPEWGRVGVKEARTFQERVPESLKLLYPPGAGAERGRRLSLSRPPRPMGLGPGDTKPDVESKRNRGTQTGAADSAPEKRQGGTGDRHRREAGRQHWARAGGRKGD